jgi:DNA-binding beta-propeller fold protein YncE
VGVFDARDGKLAQVVPVGQGPDAIVYEPVTRRVFSFNGHSSDVTAIDGRTLKVLAASIPTPGTPEFAIADGHGKVYFNVEDKGELAVLDAATLKIERHFSLAPCAEPSGLALDPQGRLYSVCRNGVMVVSNPKQGRVIGQAPIGQGPDGVAWLDGKAYSANGRDGTLSVVAEVEAGRLPDDCDRSHRTRRTNDRRRSRAALALLADGGLQAPCRRPGGRAEAIGADARHLSRSCNRTIDRGQGSGRSRLRAG